ncbi:MAG TPA: DNA repair protein RadA [bacterium]|nr:DNA repair protein RadA [bacterium]
MAKKKHTMFVCRNCGSQSLKWLGRCPECGEWDSFDEKDETAFTVSARDGKEPLIVHIADVAMTPADRVDCGSPEFNRILGGGVVRGSYNLISGAPGVGKSTLMLQIALKLAHGRKVLYLSGEESAAQVKLRFGRLSRSDAQSGLFISNENNVDLLRGIVAQEKFDVVFVDSIQSVFSSAVPGIPGSVSQIKDCAVRLLEMAKKDDITLFVIGHVTKSGTIAGPMLLEHMVDTVLYFEGDPTLGYRVLRTTKNRFGSTDEIGIFTMTAQGLEEVENPSQFFVSNREENTSGSALALIMEGTRPFLIEVQSLTTNSNLPQPRRVTSGIDNGRLAMITAVLEKRGDVYFSSFDVFVNVVGGLKLKTPASDLPIAASLLSSMFSIAVPSRVAFIGEMGLAGEIREVPGIELMLKEGARLGLKRIYVPVLRHKPKVKGLELVELKNIFGLIEEIRTMKIFE